MMRSLSIRDNGTYDECDSGAYTYSSRMRDLKKRKIVDLGNGECLYCHHPLNQPTTTTTITSVDGEYRGNRIIKKRKKKREIRKKKKRTRFIDAFDTRKFRCQFLCESFSIVGALRESFKIIRSFWSFIRTYREITTNRILYTGCFDKIICISKYAKMFVQTLGRQFEILKETLSFCLVFIYSSLSLILFFQKPWDPRIFHSAFTKVDSLISGVCRRLVLPVHTYTYVIRVNIFAYIAYVYLYLCILSVYIDSSNV